jgi:hypothetical protein
METVGACAQWVTSAARFLMPSRGRLWGPQSGEISPGNGNIIEVIGFRDIYIDQWIGFHRKILTGNPWVFTIKYIRKSFL